MQSDKKILSKKLLFEERRRDRMYKYRVDDSTTKKVKALASTNSDNLQKESAEQLIDKIKKYNSLYERTNTIEYNAPEYKRMDDVVIDEDAIKKQAEGELYEYKKTSNDKIINDTNLKREQLQQSKDSLKETFDEQTKSMGEYYDKIRTNASNDANKRGLSRSSIVINVLDAFNKDEIANYNALSKELSDNITKINSNIDNLTQQQDKALSDLDIEYAVKLQDKISKLTSDLQAKQEKVIKYNNEIAEKEAEYEQSYAKLVEDMKNKNWSKEQDVLDYVTQYGEPALTKYRQTQIYNIANEYLKTLDKESAMAMLNSNSELHTLLGESNITKLLKELSK